MISAIAFATMMLVAFYRDVSLLTRAKEIASKTRDIGIRVSSIKDIHKIISEIKYVEENKDITRDPEETLKLKQGDCEDIAVLVHSIAKFSGYRSGIAIMYTYEDSDAHAIAYINNGDKIVVFSNNDMFFASDLKEATKMLGYDTYVST